MKKSNAGRRAVPYVNIRAIFRNKRILLAVVAVVLLLIVLISSASKRKAIGKLEEEIATLQTTVSQLERENNQLESDLDLLSAQYDQTQQNVEETIRAMDLFWQIDEAYVLNRNSRCRELIETLESEALAGALPTASTTNNGRFSPFDRYAEICEALKMPYGNGLQ